MTDAVKKWLVGLALGAVVTFVVLFTRYTIKDEVATQMTEAGIPPKEVIVEMQKDIEANTERTETNKANADKLDDKIERIVDILLED